MIERKVFFIGIIEDKSRISTKEYLQRVLIEEEWKIIYENSKENISCVEKYNTTVFLMRISPKNIHLYYSIGIEFDIIIYNTEKVLDHKYLESKYFILNCDEESWLNLGLSQLNSLVVSFGFNNKASLTVSSYNDNDDIKLNLFLQREIHTIVGSTIEPFEFVINSKVISDESVYKIIAAATASLVLGNKKLNLTI